jgi:hypothetical protein
MAAPRAPLLRALGDPAIALLWAGLATSAIGDQLFTVVLTWVAVGAFGTAAGYLTVLQGAMALAVTLFLGHLTDRLNPLRVMAVSDLARALVLAVTAGAWLAAGAPQSWTLLASVAVLAGAMSFFRPALQASLPGLARDATMLPAANALLDSTERIARLLGPGLVGLASVLVPMVHFISIDVVTFLLSAVAIVAVARLRVAAVGAGDARAGTGGHGARRARGARACRAELRAGLHRVAERSLVCSVLPGSAAGDRAGRAGAAGLAHYALMISAYGSANLLGTLVMGSRPLPVHPGMWIAAGNAVLGTGIVLLGAVALYAPPGWLILGLAVASALSAFGGPMQDILVAVLRQTELPRPDLPAAVRAFMAANSAGLLLTLAVMPVLFDGLGVAQAIILCGSVILVVSALGFRRFASR